MKLQHLAIIFVIIILPISLVVGEYIQSQINTIAMQTMYSSKLQTATYDAIKAFRLNTVNNKYSSVSDSKIRDINASISTFYSSLGREIEADGYIENDLQIYTPALLYTMYDGYYIYSRYLNESTDNNEYQYGLKPYTYYSCRYKKEGIGNNDIDIIVNYTLDNYITIYGTIDTNYITKTGSIINPENIDAATRNKIANKQEVDSLKYCGVTIEKEIVTEQLIYLDSNREAIRDGKEYSYIIYDNNKVYYERIEENEGENKDQFFTINSEFKKQYMVDSEVRAELKNKVGTDKDGNYVIYNDSAVNYYVEAYKFSSWVQQYLPGITQHDAVDENGQPIEIGKEIGQFSVDTGDDWIFNCEEFNTYGDNRITDSTFDLNRIAVIRRSIQTNLLTAIANYNHLSGNTSYEYVLPVFSEEDWYKITNNISVVSFLQGMPIGTKYFNDYCVLTNNINKEVLTINSLYVIAEDENGNKEIHLANCREILDKKEKVIKAYKNIDFERQSVVISEDNECYYYPHYNTRCYSCLVNVAETYDIDFLEGNVKDYDYKTESYEIKNNVDSDTLYSLRKEVLTALARESYDLYRINEYFKGYDESVGAGLLNENENGNIITEQVFWDTNNLATARFKKKEGVKDTLKIQYQISTPENVITDRELSDNNLWITQPINSSTLEIKDRQAGDIIYLRLFDGIYDGDYKKYTIVDSLPPEETIIDIINGIKANPQNDYYINKYVPGAENNLSARIFAGKPVHSGIDYLYYAITNKNTGSIIEKTIKKPDSDGYIEEIKEDGEIEIYAMTKNYGNQSSEARRIIKKDSQEPNAPTLEVIGTKGPNNWYTSNVTVKFVYGQDIVKNEFASGIEKLHYEITRPSGIKEYLTAEDGEEITITSDGTTQIVAYMQDMAGNKSEEARITINKDTTNPIIVASLSAPREYITTKSFRLFLTARDDHSGIDKIIWYYKRTEETTYKSIETKCDGEKTNLTKDILIENIKSGAYTAYAEVYDKTGRMTRTNDVDITTENIDREPLLEANPSDWTNGNVTVSASNDTKQYIQSTGYILQYQIYEYGESYDENRTWFILGAEDTIIIEKNRFILYRFSDGINATKYETLNIKNIDKVAPGNLNIKFEYGDDITDWQFDVGIELSAEDNFNYTGEDYGTSGIAYYKVRIIGKDLEDNNVNITKTCIPSNKDNPNAYYWFEEGSYVYYFTPVDNAGNEGEESEAYYINKDSSTYKIYLKLNGGEFANYEDYEYLQSDDSNYDIYREYSRADDFRILENGATITREGYEFKGWKDLDSQSSSTQNQIWIRSGTKGIRHYEAVWEEVFVEEHIHTADCYAGPEAMAYHEVNKNDKDKNGDPHHTYRCTGCGIILWEKYTDSLYKEDYQNQIKNAINKHIVDGRCTNPGKQTLICGYDTDKTKFTYKDKTLTNNDNYFADKNFPKRLYETSGEIVIPEQIVDKENMIIYRITGIYNETFNDKGNITTVWIPNSVTMIGYRAFYSCEGINKLYLSENLINIGEEAFRGCDKLETLTLSNKLKTIGDGAFQNCTGLTSINIQRAEIIGKNAFNGCSKITSLTLPNNLKDIGEAAFQGCKLLANVNIQSVETIGNNAFNGLEKITSLTLPSNLTTIGEGAFQDCTGLTSVNFQNAKTEEINAIIGKNAFKGCTGITSLTLPNNLKTIEGGTKEEEGAFQNCTSLTSVNIQSAITIGEDAFNGCKKITSLILPNNLETIGARAFKGASSIELSASEERVLIIPETTTTIGKNAFWGCKLTSVTFENTTGWKYGSTPIDVTNTADNVKYLSVTEKYRSKVWTRSDS